MISKYVSFGVLIAAIVSFAACGSSGADAKNNTEQNASVDLSNNPDYQKGLSLIGKQDCMTCHDIRMNTTGPAYINVSKKYAATPENIEMLVKKIQKGGSGHWGNIPMTPHPDLSSADATQIVKYILLLKNAE